MYVSVGAARARWLAELNAALEEALRLVKLAETTNKQSGVLDLISRIEAARREIRALQIGGRRRIVKFDPLWNHSAGWEENRTGVARLNSA
jgi:hypothetical protein